MEVMWGVWVRVVSTRNELDVNSSCWLSISKVKYFLCLDIDELAPADSLWTTQPDGAVKIRASNSSEVSGKPVTVVTLLKNTVRKLPNGTALGESTPKLLLSWLFNSLWPTWMATSSVGSPGTATRCLPRSSYASDLKFSTLLTTLAGVLGRAMLVT